MKNEQELSLHPVFGFPGYAMTKDGRVWSFPKRGTKGGWLRPQKNTRGYLFVGLAKQGKTCNRMIHRLLLETFVGPCPDGAWGRHLDGNQSNNRLENLRWGTPSENFLDTVRYGGHIGNAKLTPEQVREIRTLWTNRTTRTTLAQRFGVSRATISWVTSNRIWKFVK